GAGSGPESPCRRSTAATGRGHAIWHHGAQIVARPHDGRAHDVAGWLAGSAIYRQLRIALLRIEGVGDILVFGAPDYSMRVWPDPAKVAERGLTAGEVVAALRAANLQVAAGAINQPPAKSPVAFQLAVQTLGRLSDPGQFENIMVRADADGGYVRLRDIARVELGSQDYTLNSYLNSNVATALVVRQRPGSNALATAATIKNTMEQLSRTFPSGVGYVVAYNPTEFIQLSIDEVKETLL